MEYREGKLERISMHVFARYRGYTIWYRTNEARRIEFFVTLDKDEEKVFRFHTEAMAYLDEYDRKLLHDYELSQKTYDRTNRRKRNVRKRISSNKKWKVVGTNRKTNVQMILKEFEDAESALKMCEDYKWFYCDKFGNGFWLELKEPA